MKYDPKIHHRRSIRLKEYDYSRPGAYFITICVQNRECVLGEVVCGDVVLSPAGVHVLNAWRELPDRFKGIELDAFCMMPNHIHGIIVITSEVPSASLSDIVGVFKSFSARRINKECRTSGIPFWQRNYYEHIIRNETEWEKIRSYIQANPDHWQEDELHPNG